MMRSARLIWDNCHLPASVKHSARMRTSLRSLSLALAGICLFGPQIVAARATTFTWLGLGSSDAWTNTDGNWDRAGFPGFAGPGDMVLFPAFNTQRYEVTFDSGILGIANITFERPGYSVWLRSGSLASTGGIAATTANAADFRIDIGFSFGGDATVRNLTGAGEIYAYSSSVASTLNVVGPASNFSGSIRDGISLNVGDGTQAASLTLNRHPDFASNYTGTTTVRANATLATGNADALSAASAHVINGTLNLAGGSATVGGLSGSGAVTLGGKNLTVNGGGWFTGVISGAGSLIKTGASAFTIAGFAEQTGDPNGLGTVIRGGSLSVTGGQIDHGTAETIVGYMSGDNASLMIRDNSSVTDDDGFIAFATGSTGEALVDGGRWDNAGDLVVGQGGTGTFTIQAGGVATGKNGILAASAGSSGTATVNGGTWTTSLTLAVGSFGTGSLTIINNGEVSSRFGDIAEAPGSVGTVDITSGKWDVGVGYAASNSLFVGMSGTGTLNVASTGLLTSAATSIGDQAGSSGTVNINGGKWTSSYYTIVGNAGPGTLNITNGGEVTNNEYAIIGFRGEGIATVDNSTWNASNIIVGSFGPATLNVQNGATVTSSGIVLLAENDIGSGTLNIGAYDKTKTAGTLDATQVQFGEGTGTINFNQTDAITFAPGITGEGSVKQRGSGTTTLGTANNFTGTTTVESGTLVAAHSQALGASAVKVSGGTLLIETGIAVSNSVKIAGGTLAQKVNAGAQLDTLHTFESALPGGIATEAKLLEGTASSSSTISGSFTNSFPAFNDGSRISDSLSLDGVPVVDLGTGQTDMFVLQISVANVDANSFLGWWDSSTNTWVNAVNGNFGGIAFFAGNRAYTPADFQLGTYGVDTANGAVWAVLNHNSDFAAAAIPEPSTWALIGAGLTALAVIRRRRAP